MERSWLKSLLAPGSIIRIGIAIAAAVVLWLLISAWIGDRTSLAIDVTSRPIDLLSPQWLHLIAVIPAFYVLRVLSLTDLSLLQQVVQATLRSLVIAGIAIALSRPSWITQTSKVSTIVLVDVSDSVSDKQLAAARHYVDDIEKKEGDGNLQVITFAEKPSVVRATGGKSLVDSIARHIGAGAGTDTQAAMQLAYGLFPQGFLPHIVIISDGNQTEGDVAVEAYRAKDLGVKVSWKNFDADPTPEVRVVGVTAPDDIKVGQPYEVTAEVWSTEPQTVTLSLQQDEFPNGREPLKTVALREGKNLVKFTSEAKRAGYTTYKLRLAQVAHDTEKANNEAVMTAPVKGRPSILYVEGGVLREPGSAGYLKKALEHENIDVEV
ncbi:MAG: vWA domain-containing protein, partial [Deltaproteobacteria bacterium]